MIVIAATLFANLQPATNLAMLVWIRIGLNRIRIAKIFQQLALYEPEIRGVVGEAILLSLEI